MGRCQENSALSWDICHALPSDLDGREWFRRPPGIGGIQDCSDATTRPLVTRQALIARAATSPSSVTHMPVTTGSVMMPVFASNLACLSARCTSHVPTPPGGLHHLPHARLRPLLALRQGDQRLL